MENLDVSWMIRESGYGHCQLSTATLKVLKVAINIMVGQPTPTSVNPSEIRV